MAGAQGCPGGLRRRASSKAASRGACAASVTGAAKGGPRRLSRCTFSVSVPCNSSRNLAGDDSLRVANVRNTNNSDVCCCAARFRRRSAMPGAWGSPASTAATWLQCSACSAAHRRAAGLSACTHSSCGLGSPQAARLGPKGWSGAPTNTTGPLRICTACTSAGSSNCQTCCSGRGCSTSIRLPSGQPPPGNCASSAAWPLDRVVSRAWASSCARQMCGRVVARKCGFDKVGKVQNTVYLYSILPSSETPFISISSRPSGLCREPLAFGWTPCLVAR